MLPSLHCTYCGTRWVEPFLSSPRVWPRTCSGCQEMTWKNPVPVVVCLVPLSDHSGHVLAVRRGIPPDVGGLALPGGYLESGETWQDGASREVEEECGIVIPPEDFRLVDVLSTPRNPDVLLVFGEALTPVVFGEVLFEPNEEVQEVVPARGGLAFPTHEEVLLRYLGQSASRFG